MGEHGLPTFRRRRAVFVTFLSLFCTLLFFAPATFWDTTSNWVPRNVAFQYTGQRYGYTELSMLLHMVASSDYRIPRGVDATKRLGKEAYGPSLHPPGVQAKWARIIATDPPVIVFSKSYCPYSKKAKALIESYNITPRPVIVEVDLREDADSLQTALIRLTHHRTFPNIVIKGRSYGGYDDLQKMHENGSLLSKMKDAGVVVARPPQANAPGPNSP